MTRRAPMALAALSFFLLGTVVEQRARLPAASTDCGDPVAGTWVSHTYFPHVNEWYKFSIELGSDGPDAVKSGVLHADYWDGVPEDVGPVQCGRLWNRQGIVEQVTWSFDGTTLAIDGTRFERDASHPCAGDVYGTYGLDRFDGVVDPDLQEFQAVLNSGPGWNNVPIVFRRVECAGKASSGDPPRPARDPSPRAPRPPVARGWGCW